MANKVVTIEEATKQWVSEFNFYPQSLIEKAYSFDEIIEAEITPTPKIWQCDECSEEFSQEEIDDLDDYTCPSCLEKDEDTTATIEEIEDCDSKEYGLPMWGTLFNPQSSLDEDWIRNNLEVVAECGFRIYDFEETGILLGIDGAGYSFYDNHWIPLYKEIGLQWHTKVDESN